MLQFKQFYNDVISGIEDVNILAEARAKKKWAKDIKVQKGKMTKLLLTDKEIESGMKISDKYTSGKKLAADLIKALDGNKKKAAGMLAFAANIAKGDDIYDKALRALKFEESVSKIINKQGDIDMKDAKMLMESYKKMIKEEEEEDLEINPKVKKDITVDADKVTGGISTDATGLTQLLMAMTDASAKDGVIEFFKSINVPSSVIEDLKTFFDKAADLKKDSGKKGEGKQAKLSELMKLSMKIDSELYSNPKILTDIMNKIGEMK